MSRLTEKHVQKVAIDYLVSHYKEKYQFTSHFSKAEVCTKKRFGKNRADGLLCFISRYKKEHVVSIEAKSHKTINALIALFNDDKMGLHYLYIFGIVPIITIYFLRNLEWYWILLSALLGIVLAIVIYTYVFMEHSSFRNMKVINQTKKYPANEKWIVVSRDSLNLSMKKKHHFSNGTNEEYLIQKCRQGGIGLLVVNRIQPHIIVEPKFIKGDYLKFYSKESDIRKHILNDNR